MADVLLIQGGNPLYGQLKASGAKNAALPIMAASLLASEPVILNRIPNISDVRVLAQILQSLGCKVEFLAPERLLIDSRQVNRTSAPYELGKMMNASFDIIGALLSRFREAEVPLPGGCKLGNRSVDLHIEGFKALGAEVAVEHGFVKAKAKKLSGKYFGFSKCSVGATKTVMMAACLAQGKTVLENVAQEPEVSDLINFLNSLGASIKGAGTSRLVIQGQKELGGGEYDIIGDRIETGTYLLAGAITEGEVEITGIDPQFLEIFLQQLQLANQEVEIGENSIKVKGRRPIAPLQISTAPFPGFATDLHPPMAAFLTQARGTSVIEENIFNSRFMYIQELNRLGSEISSRDRSLMIKGPSKLSCAPVEAPDIRAGGALVLAALRAEGETEVSGVEYLDRGYQHIEEKLGALGAKIRRQKKDAHRN